MKLPLPTKRHLLAVLLEDYFHVGAFDNLIQRGQWSRFEARFEHNTLTALDLLDRFEAKVTFFSLGWIAERQPNIIREITRRGHEIACYSNLNIENISQAEFKEEILRTRDALQQASGQKVLGFRAAHRWQMSEAEWALKILAEEGFAYDASIVPTKNALRVNPDRRFAWQVNFAEKQIWEFPV